VASPSLSYDHDMPFGICLGAVERSGRSATRRVTMTEMNQMLSSDQVPGKHDTRGPSNFVVKQAIHPSRLEQRGKTLMETVEIDAHFQILSALSILSADFQRQHTTEIQFHQT
jgi:hypothetical protein